MAKATVTINSVEHTHRISALAIDVSGEVPALRVTFDTRTDDPAGPVLWQTTMPLAGDEFVDVFGQPGDPQLSRVVEDITACLFDYAITNNVIAGTFDPE